MVPNGTWNNLLYSLLPGDGVKLSYNGLLCLLASTAKTSATPARVSTTRR
ncbi:MAG: ABC-2 type transport system ATP-binding protein [Janthinobacterium sp.]|jgi:ABC-2 type transport system ATP-binding protein